MANMRNILLSAVPAAAAVMNVAPRASVGETFGLYAYGDGVSGLRVFSMGGLAYLGNANTTGVQDSLPVVFTETDDSTFLANPDLNATEWSNATFYVPTADAAPGQAGFLMSNDSSTTDAITSGWTWYGHVLMLEEDSEWLTLFTACPSNYTGAWELYWNSDTNVDGSCVLVTMKDTAPAN